MRYPILLILLGASALLAHPFETADSSRFSLELGVGFGNYLGDITDEDGEYYRNIGFGLVDDKGAVQPMDPAGTKTVLEAACLFTVANHLALGPAFKYQHATEDPGMMVKDEDGTELLSAKIVMAKVRWEPLGVQNVRVGLEGGIGFGFGTLRRFGLATEHTDLIRRNLQDQAATYNLSSSLIEDMISYGTEGNRPLDLLGLHFKLAARTSVLLRYGWGFFGTLGFERTNWKVAGDDPLNTRISKYPMGVSGFGFEFMIGAFKEF